MKFVCIVAEYNPLHNGHVYHLGLAKRLAQHVVVIMSGDFCQRGTDTVLDKYTRAAHAVRAGADVVVELPTLAAVHCAEQYARGAVRLAAAISDSGMSFGSECGDLSLLQATVDLLDSEDVNAAIRDLVATGMAYPKARQQALETVAHAKGMPIADIGAPNNILAMEYIRRSAGKLPLHTVCRTTDYHGKSHQASASYIRRAVEEGLPYQDLVPTYVCADLAHATPKDDLMYVAELRAHPKAYFEGLLDAREGLQNRIWQNAERYNTLAEIVEHTMTKRYTRAHINRLCTAALLNLRNDDLAALYDAPPYYNVLAVADGKQHLLGELSKAGSVITTQSELRAHPLGRIDAKAHDMYRLIHRTDLSQGMLVVKR